jgi:hypothetical protein
MSGESLDADPDPGEPESNSLSPLPPPAPAPPNTTTPSPLALDRQGLLEAAGGTVIALIALFSSYDHITVPGRALQLQQQWDVWLIAASLALVLADAQLATRSRSREKARLDREEDSRQRGAHEANRERNRAAARAERKRQAAALSHRCALLSGWHQLDPSSANRDRFQAFLSLMADAAGDFDPGDLD